MQIFNNTISSFIVVVLVPQETPQSFRLNPDKTVTDKTADFQWTSVNTGPWRMQGFFRGYKVNVIRFITNLVMIATKTDLDSILYELVYFFFSVLVIYLFIMKSYSRQKPQHYHNNDLNTRVSENKRRT